MMRKSVRLGAVALALAAAFSAEAASPVAGGYDGNNSNYSSANELRRLQDLSDDDRLERLERLQDAGTRYQAQLVQQIQQLQSQLMDIQGQLEETQYKLQQLQQRGVGTAAPPLPTGGDTNPDTSLNAAGQPLPENAGTEGMGSGFGGAIATGTPSPSGQTPAQVQLPPGSQPAQLMPAGPNELADLDKAFQQVRNKQYDAAVQSYSQFIASYPNSENTPTAHYWLGQVYFAKRDYDGAQKEFQTVVDRYPDHAKTDEALLKLAYIYQSKGNNQQAAQIYSDIVKRYPGKPSAQLANKRLDALKKG